MGRRDHASASSHHARAWRSSQPVRDASDSSAPCSPPNRCTTHSPTLSQRTPRSLSETLSRSQRYFETVRSAREDSPVVALKSGISSSIRSAASSPRESYHAIDGTTGSPSRPSSTPVSAMPETPTPTMRASSTPSSAARAASSAQSTNVCGSISAPVGTVRQASGAWPWAISSPSGVTTAALHEVVPRSSPSRSSRGAEAPRIPSISRTACRARPGCRPGCPW